MKKFIRDIKFAKIQRNRKIEDSLVIVFRKAFSLNKSLFKRLLKKFKIIICDTRKEFKKEAKYHYRKWSTATVLRDATLVTRSPGLIEKIGRWKRKDFQNIMNHEMNHVFWTDFYGTAKPCWLCEGLACYIGNNYLLTKNELLKIVKKYKVDPSILDYRYLKRNLTGHFPRYPVWANFTQYLAKRYSASKLIRLMDRYIKNPRKSNYMRIFVEIFGKTDKELFNKFIHHITKTI
jgi:hypothetical protein